MTARVAPAQRFTKDRPCPRCGGHPLLPQGHGVRCYGFLSSDGRYAHCTREDYAGALDPEPGSDTFAHRLDGPCRCGIPHGEPRPHRHPGTSANGASPTNPDHKAHRVYRNFREAGATQAYDYRDEQGTVLFQTWRIPRGDGRKTFMQARPVANGWETTIHDVRRVPYRLPEVLAADMNAPVLLCEGEKDADRLAALGCVSTTLPMGAGKWRPEYAETFRGRPVVLLLDNDADGEKHGRVVAEGLHGIASSVRLLRLPDLPPKGDVSDWLDDGGSAADLRTLITQTSHWAPNPAAQKADQPPAARLVVSSLSDITAQPIAWHWHRWLPRGKFHLIGGYAGDGKSTLLAALAAQGSRGGCWPDESRVPRRIRTLFLLGEDSASDTLKPRLALHGADMDHIFVIETVLDEKGQERFFNIAKHLDLLEQAVIEHRIDWIVIDPLTTIMPGADRNAEGDTRDALTPLIKLAERLDVTITGVAHVGKSDSSRRAAQKILGATAFHALARVVWMIAPDGDERMALGVVKSNLAMKPVALAWSRGEDGPIVWDGVASQSVEDLLSGSVPASPRADAEGFLREYLAGGSCPSNVVEAEAKARGISRATLRRAADALRIKKWKDSGPNGNWYWSLPDGEPRAAADPETSDEGNLLTPIHTQVSKLSKFPESNLLTDEAGEHLHATTPLFRNGHSEPQSSVMEGAQLAHLSPIRGEQVTSGEGAQRVGGEQVPSPQNGHADLDPWKAATRVVLG